MLLLQGYDACTWESEQCTTLMQPEHVQLHLALWDRQHRALARTGEEARRRERLAAQAAERQLPGVSARVQGSGLVPVACGEYKFKAHSWFRLHASCLWRV